MAARSAPAASVHTSEEYKAACTLQSHYRGHVIRTHSRNMLAGVARYGKRGLAIHNEIMKRTHEFAILLMPGVDLHVVHDALRKEEVFYHSYEYKNQRGMLQVLLMVNAGRARLYRALCELEQLRWMRRENHAGHPPPRPFKIPKDFKVRGRRVEDEEEGGGSGREREEERQRGRAQPWCYIPTSCTMCI